MALSSKVPRRPTSSPGIPRKKAAQWDDETKEAVQLQFQLSELQAEQPAGSAPLDELTDQFITRRLGESSDSLCTELVIRLCNEFPTTEREAKEFERRTRMHEEKLDEVVDGMLGSSLGKKLTDAEKEQMKNMMREQSAAASAAAVAAEQTAEAVSYTHLTLPTICSV